MNETTIAIDVTKTNYFNPVKRFSMSLTSYLLVLFLSFDAIVLKGADHILMLNRPEQFNRALEKAISKILRNTVK